METNDALPWILNLCHWQARTVESVKASERKNPYSKEADCPFMNQLLHGLPLRMRQVVILKAVMGLELHEIARIVGGSFSGTGYRYTHGMIRLERDTSVMKSLSSMEEELRMEAARGIPEMTSSFLNQCEMIPQKSNRSGMIRKASRYQPLRLVVAALLVMALVGTTGVYHMVNRQHSKITVTTEDNMSLSVNGMDRVKSVVADKENKRAGANADGSTLTEVMTSVTKEELDAYAAGSDQAEGEEDPAGSTKEEAREFWRKNGMDAYDFCVLETVEDKDNYVLNVILDRKTAQQSLEMWGSLEDGSYFLLRAPLESVHNSSSLANSFFLRVGLVITAIGAVMAMILAGTVTRPIRELTEISTRMKKLDFSAKYEGTSRTEIADLGQNINELSETLEQTISELKAANNELRRDIRRKEEVEAMRQDFLASVTHELKTPLALIQGYAEGLQEGISDDPESRDYYCEVIVDEAGKMNRMVQKLLTLNQLEFGNNAVTMEHFDITELVRNYLSRAELLAEQNGITVSMQETGPIMVWADEFLVEEVFANYYSNACNHAAGDKIIDIRFEEKENTVRVSVFNSGSPIPSESLPHLWEKFYKVDKARTRAYGGSGVGLSIVRAIMNLLHQEYGVINYDNGVKFWFELDTSGAERQKDEPDTSENEV